MASRKLDNVGKITGQYAGINFQDSPSTPVSVTLTDVPFAKKADQSVWFGGQLLFTLEVDNTGGDETVTIDNISDDLDTTKFLYVDGSVVVTKTTAGTPATLVLGTDYTVAYTAGTPTGKLVVTFLAGGAGHELAMGEKLDVSFRGTKVAA